VGRLKGNSGAFLGAKKFMDNAGPTNGRAALSEEVRRATRSLALWMQIFALLGLPFAVLRPLLTLRRESAPELEESIAIVVVTAVGIVIWLLLWLCARAFRRIAKEPAGNADSLAAALRRLRTFFCVVSVLWALAAGFGIGLGLYQAKARARAEAAAAQRNADNANKALEEFKKSIAR
jgi:formate-dependent nitrite reductase membrane component NrfD